LVSSKFGIGWGGIQPRASIFHSGTRGWGGSDDDALVAAAIADAALTDAALIDAALTDAALTDAAGFGALDESQAHTAAPTRAKVRSGARPMGMSA
jgi:hypothetical protein